MRIYLSQVLETLESIFIMYRITGDPKYQVCYSCVLESLLSARSVTIIRYSVKEYGWEIFQAIEKYCKTSSGYSAIYRTDFLIQNENSITENQSDSMER